MSSVYSAPPRTSYTLCDRLHPGHQQELGQCPNRTHPGLVPSWFSLMSSSDESTLAPTVGIIDASTSARRSKTLEVRLTASIIEKRIKNSSSSTGLIVIRGLRCRFRLLPRLLLLSDNFSYDETILLHQVTLVHHHSITFIRLATNVCWVRHLVSFLSSIRYFRVSTEI